MSSSSARVKPVASFAPRPAPSLRGGGGGVDADAILRGLVNTSLPELAPFLNDVSTNQTVPVVTAFVKSLNDQKVVETFNNATKDVARTAVRVDQFVGTVQTELFEAKAMVEKGRAEVEKQVHAVGNAVLRVATFGGVMVALVVLATVTMFITKAYAASVAENTTPATEERDKQRAAQSLKVGYALSGALYFAVIGVCLFAAIQALRYKKTRGAAAVVPVPV